MENFREMMQARSNIAVSRQVLRKILGGEPIRCIPIVRDGRKDYAIRGETRLGILLTAASVQMASPRGFEPRLPPRGERIYISHSKSGRPRHVPLNPEG